MKNKIFIISSLLVVLLFTACEDDYEAPTTFSDVAWAASILPTATPHLNAGEYMSFMDLSQNAVSHKWTIDQGNHFLNAGFENKDTLDNFINSEMGTETEETTVHVLFKNPGLNKVHFYNTFSEKVSYNSKIPFEAVEKDGVWVIDTTFIIDVYGEIKPAFKVMKGEEELLSVTADQQVDLKDTASWPVVDLEAGAFLTYIDLSEEGRPKARSWGLNGARPNVASDSIAEVTYLSLGKYRGSITAQRSGEFPQGSVRKEIPLWINVIKSNQPFQLIGGVQELEDETLKFNVTGELVPFVGEESNFKVRFVNPNGQSGDLTVVSASVNSIDKTQIDLKLQEAIYNSDEVYVEYIGGNISSVDERNLGAFTETQAEMFYANSVVDPDIWGFEKFKDHNGYADGWWAQHSQWERTDEQKAVGNFSYRFKTDDISTGGDYTVHGPEGTFGLPLAPGTYRMSMQAYLGEGSTISMVRTNFTLAWKVLEWRFDLSKTNQWQTITMVVDFPDGNDKVKLQAKASDAPLGGAQQFYVDDIQAIPLEVRP